MPCPVYHCYDRLFIAKEKQNSERKIANIFLLISFIEKVLLSAPHICFDWEIRKLIFNYLLSRGLFSWSKYWYKSYDNEMLFFLYI